LDAALSELGWPDALATDRRAAVSLLFDLSGENGASSSALEVVVAEALGLSAEGVGVVLPALGSGEPPGHLDGGTVVVHGTATAAFATRARALIVARASDGEVTVAVDTDGLAARPVEGLDPEMGLVEMTGRTGADGAVVCPPGAWEHAVAVGRLAISHELVGASRAMLELARDHARERVQFGRPIASFQAVRHRLADSLVAVQGAEAALSSAWDDGTALTAALAKAIAGECARTVAGHCQQVLAGMGFTTEHPFHRYLRRSILLDQVLGDGRSLLREVGETLLEARALPSLLPL
jgi:alkylation response protein AidB-like acyl-CoA dehydrogenase